MDGNSEITVFATVGSDLPIFPACRKVHHISPVRKWTTPEKAACKRKFYGRSA